MRKAREARAKAEAETAERARAWDEAKAREKAYISRLGDEDREKTKFKARASKNAKALNRTAVEAASKIRESADIQGANR